MKEKLKNIGWSVLGLGFIVLVLFIVALIFQGGLWLSATIYPYLLIITRWTFVITLFILLPLSFFKRLRGITGVGMIIASYTFGASLWIESLLLTYMLWGGIAVFIGLFLLGVGVVPIAMLATLFNGMWSTLGELFLLLILTFGSRFLGIYLVEKYEAQKNK